MKRWATAAGAAAFFIAAAVWLDMDPRVPHRAFQDYSLHSRSAKGCSLAALYLAERGWPVKSLHDDLDVPAIAATATLFRFGPGRGLSPELALHAPPLRPPVPGGTAEKEARLLGPEEDAWVRGGGRLVLALDHDYGPVSVKEGRPGAPLKTFPLWPRVKTLAPPAGRTLGGAPLDLGSALFSEPGGPLVSRLALGAGEVFLLSVPEIFQNAHLAAADHLPLLEALAGPGRPVVIDERIHGFRRDAGLLDLLRRWGFGPFLVLGVLASLAAFWHGRCRLGPPADEVRETRIEAVDFVDSLALLYARVLPRQQALDMYIRAFERALAVQLGLRGAALEARIRQDLPARARQVKGKDLSEDEFKRRLQVINEAFRRLNDAKHSRRP